MRLWPQSIRWQMLAGLVLLEVLSIALFAIILVTEQKHEIRVRAEQQLSHQTQSLALQAREAFLQHRLDWVDLSVRMMGDSPNVSAVKISDPDGKLLYIDEGEVFRSYLMAEELAQLSQVKPNQGKVFGIGRDRLECVAPIYANGILRGYAWVETDSTWDQEQINFIRSSIAIFAGVWVAVSGLLVLLLARSISRPLAILHRGTKALTSTSESGHFPLPVLVHNEMGDLIEAFNRMVASLIEQRSGLNDTLSLLDSMLENAPVGLAFFDRRCRFVRVNQVFADMTGISLSRHLGRTIPELLPQPVSGELENAILRVFSGEQPVHNLELNSTSGKLWTWLASAYPVRTTSQHARWVGVIVLDASERKRNEETLRRTEKLVATGRLAASIAHEINNPLEAITNLLYLLRDFCSLDEIALQYVKMAEHEAQRIAEITQQTLGFYRQSTLPVRTNIEGLLDSVLALYHGKLQSLNIDLERDYDRGIDLFCYAGEVRQVFANLISNAIDAMSSGGRLRLRARRSHDWREPGRPGIRFAVADTGCGMTPQVLERIFEAFFTTKEVTGTGLGLWVSQGIIEKHRGTIRIRSRIASQGKSRGTVFQVFLPDGEA